MRLNQFIAQATGLSRREADRRIEDGEVKINGSIAQLGAQVSESDAVTLNDAEVQRQPDQTIVFHKPVGYVTSRAKQGNTPTIYELLPQELHRLKPIGRLDKDSSGLLLLTSDGNLAQRLAHPSAGKWKRYRIHTQTRLSGGELERIRNGVGLEDGISRFKIQPDGDGYLVELQEGRNRQIRRTIEAVGNLVTRLHRTNFGLIALDDLEVGEWRQLDPKELEQT
jgi:23S rRNA pseudouridine2605 synthase